MNMYPKIKYMKKLSPKILAAIGIVTLASCAAPEITTTAITDENRGCVAGFVETSPGKGTIDILFPSDFAPDVQSIKDVSIEVAEEVTRQIGRC